MGRKTIVALIGHNRIPHEGLVAYTFTGWHSFPNGMPMSVPHAIGKPVTILADGETVNRTGEECLPFDWDTEITLLKTRRPTDAYRPRSLRPRA